MDVSDFILSKEHPESLPPHAIYKDLVIIRSKKEQSRRSHLLLLLLLHTNDEESVCP
jgi:hypothetical protein